MSIKDFYEMIGGSYTTALSRLMRDSLIEKFVLKFADDKTFGQLREAAEAENWDAAFAPAHTLKGVALNLAFENLGASANALTDALRPQNVDSRDPAALKAMFARVSEDYETVMTQLEIYRACRG